MLDIDRQAPALRRVVRSRSSTSANCTIVLLSDSSASARLSTTRDVGRPPNQPSAELYSRSRRRQRHQRHRKRAVARAPAQQQAARHQTRRRRRQQRRIGESAVVHAAQRRHVRRASRCSGNTLSTARRETRARCGMARRAHAALPRQPCCLTPRSTGARPVPSRRARHRRCRCGACRPAESRSSPRCGSPSMLTLRSASSAANRPRRSAQTPSNTRRASRSTADCAAISQPHVNTPEAHAVARERQHRRPREHVQQVAGPDHSVARSVPHSVAVTPRPRSLVANAPSANLARIGAVNWPRSTDPHNQCALHTRAMTTNKHAKHTLFELCFSLFFCQPHSLSMPLRSR
jgi:hypothetical protein